MLVPVLRRIKDNKSCFVERVFPFDGNLGVEIGSYVEPFNSLGDCRFSQNQLKLPKDFKPSKFKTDRKFYYSGSLLGKMKREKVLAPYDGTLILTENKEYFFEENERKYVLLSGVWGSVKSIHDKKAVLLETQTKDLLFSASTKNNTSGELVVFPNPSDILKKSYLENFVKGIKGKIIYIGHYVGLDVVKRAFDLEASAVIAGSTHSEVFDYAKNNNFSLGVFSGFGKIKTPDSVYKLLSSVSYRFVFFEGSRNILRIPIKVEDLSQPESSIKTKKNIDTAEDAEIFKNVEEGMKVQVLQDPYFGWSGTVDRVSESSIFVKFGFDSSSAEIKLPNFLIVE